MRTVEVTDQLQAYMDGLLAPRDAVLARMEEEAHRENIPIVDAQEGALLSLLVKLARAGKVVLLPHMGSATLEGRIEMGEKVLINIKTFADGHKPPDRVLATMF